MTDFKFSIDDVDNQTIRIMQKLAPLLADEHPAHAAATATLMLASYITILSSEAGADSAEVDAMIDRMTDKVRRAAHYQRAHYALLSNPGNT